MNIKKLMKQAEKMQQEMQQKMAEIEVEAAVGGGMVTVRMNGQKELTSVSLDPEAIDPEDPGMLEDLVLAAVNEASRRVDEELQGQLGSMTGGLPGMPNLPGF